MDRMSKGKCIDELFDEQAERNPDAVAVVCEDRELSYRDLNGRSNELAHYLQELGTGSEKLVAICLERSLELPVGLLEKLAAALREQGWEPMRSPLVAIQPRVSRPPFFGVHAGRGEVMFHTELTRCLGAFRCAHSVFLRMERGYEN
jgi:non-ribosomal peptide synthetase component F